MDQRVKTGLLGANSLVGECVISRLRNDGRHTVAFSRHPSGGEPEPGVTWLQLPASLPAHPDVPSITHWLCVAPIWVLPQYFGMIEISAARRVVALSSTSLFVKKDSSDHGERHLAQRLAEGERAFRTWAETQGVEWVILRPTLIYGRGRDKNLTEITRFVRRWGFFPLLGEAEGLRAPVHAEDVAAACVSALTSPAAVNRTYNLSGGETMSYREMVSRVFSLVGKVPYLVTIPRSLFRPAVAAARLVPRYRHWTVEMAERMNRDLVFDHADAVRDLGFAPRPFRVLREDLPR
ncbi:NAD-dependent epimerase/dehydratase family protein [Candidatus Nitrospira nitrificans]|uniref:Hopanoid-associated sugar epimerase n=1 Tax=Candidatus Nitrospira nitrificans TaxID=1742973 RepID=A0A0S4LGP2_9BACT|nr:NAD-dependent epimerase/dehydratase family protein [Candidatus Nitrospira nitrificans]CUS36073.1 Hopanoid-associated sugar epimerase [Candidatus Nitrospira nitrificans]